MDNRDFALNNEAHRASHPSERSYLILRTGTGKSLLHFLPVLNLIALRGWKTPPAPRAASRYVQFSGELSPTTLTKGRGEQGLLRARKLAGRTHALCALCREEYPASLLELTHINPRANVESDREKLDLWNVMLACGQCHSLFDKGLLWVNGSGVVQWEGGFGPDHLLTVWGERAAGGRCLEFREGNRGFFRARLSYSRVLT
ncbi:HNH endonuclease signature motif containing protein [Nocardiopsis codii]|nr:HNH endonuclease signature motif containing protein [Nocardiopsis sp. CT-R113]